MTFRRAAYRGITLQLFVVAATASAGQERGFLEAGMRHHARVPYLLYAPAAYEKEEHRRWPLIIYLHGGSARGGDLEKLRKIGLPARLEKERDFPFIVASPLCAEGEIWSDAEAIGALVERLTREYRVDLSRVYLTGHSMGGRGALYFAYRMPERFAAVAALSPLSPITAWSKGLTEVPLWLIHGAKDEQSPLRETTELVQAMEKDGGHPRFSPLPERDHFILDWYERDEIFDWLAEQRTIDRKGAR